VYMLIRSYIVTTVDVFDAQAEVFHDRLLYSTNGISYYDHEIGRLYPGVIDMEKLDQQNFDSIILNSVYYGKEHVDPQSGFENREIGAKMTAYSDDNPLYTTKVAYYNKDYYEYYRDVALGLKGVKGPGGARKKGKISNVLIKDGNTIVPGKLELEVVISKT